MSKMYYKDYDFPFERYNLVLKQVEFLFRFKIWKYMKLHWEISRMNMVVQDYGEREDRQIGGTGEEEWSEWIWYWMDTCV